MQSRKKSKRCNDIMSKAVKSFAFLILFVTLIVTGCEKEECIHNIIDEGSMSLKFDVNGEELIIPVNSESKYFDVTTLNTEFGTTFYLSNSADFNYVKVNGSSIKGGETLSVKVDKIAYNEHISIEYSFGNSVKTVYIRT